MTGLIASNITFNSVTLSWNAIPDAIGYRLVATSGQYGDTIPMVTTNNYTYSGLEPESEYHFYVQTICSDEWYAETWAEVIATTPERPDYAADLTVTTNDASMGYVTINGIETTIYTGLLGDRVSLAAIPHEGYLFMEWSDGETEAARSYLLSDISATLMASFAPSEDVPNTATASCVLSPNPARGSTRVAVKGISGKVRIVILDIRGRELIDEMLECNADCEKAIGLEGLTEGAYFVRVISEGSDLIVKKLIVRS